MKITLRLRHIILAIAFVQTVVAYGATVPFEFDANKFDGGQIYIPCSYSGFNSRCFFDSGAGNRVTNNLVTRNLTPIRQDTVMGGSGIEITCDVVVIKNWIVGELNMKDVEAVRCADSMPSDTDTLGISFFSGLKFSLNFKTKKIETDINAPSSVAIQPLIVYPSNHSALEVNVLGTPFKAIFDTGAGISAVDQALVTEMPEVFKCIQDLQGYDSNGNPILVKLYRMSGLAVGGTSFPPVLVIAMDFAPFKSVFSGMRMFLGPSVMKYQNWFFDVPSRKWAIIP